MKILILIHVLSAIIGIGPTFFSHVLLRKNQTPLELQSSMRLMKRLEVFPKVGGSLAVLTGLALVIFSDYGRFTQLWLIGSLVLYILIQITVIGIISPRANKLAKWVLDPENERAASLPDEQNKSLNNVGSLFYVASSLGVLLFIFMILRP